MHRSLCFLGIAVMVGGCLLSGCRKEEPTPAKPKAKEVEPAPSDDAPAPKPPADTTAAKPDETPKKEAAPPKGPMRLGESRNPDAKADPAKKTAKAGPRRKGARDRHGWKKIPRPDRTFHCIHCGNTYTMTADEATPILRDAYKKNPGHRPELPCPKCKQKGAVPAMKCTKCDGIITAPTTFPTKMRGPLPDKFYDKCPKCGYSKMRERLVQGVRKRMKQQPNYDIKTAPSIIQQAVEEAKARGEW
jgi:hypothetical protein